MAFDSVANLSTQIVDGFSLSADGLPGRSIRKAAFGGFLHQENDLAHVELQEGRGHLAGAEKATGIDFFRSRPERQRHDCLNRLQPISTMRIEAHPVPEHARIEVLPRHFGRHMLTVERCIYDLMSQFASTYSGGCWSFFELGNGGFYMSPPDDAYDIRIDSNGFRGRMSADAAGITVCLIAFSHLSSEYTTDAFSKHFHCLRDFARDHPQAGVIFQAID